MKSIQDRATAYLGHMPVSVQGQGGRGALFEAAATLVRGFDLSADDALPLLEHWNHACLPCWTERDLRQALRSAATTSTRTPGYLLDKKSPSSSYSSSSSPSPQRSTTPPSSATAPGTTPPPPADEAARKARQRTAWPDFHPASAAHLRIIAELRHLLPDAVDLAQRWGFLKTAVVDGHACYILHEGTFAQARRLDGQPFTRHDGTAIKARNLPGSEGAFIGQRWLGRTTHVLLVEGVVGLLEALAALSLANTAAPWSLLAATSASSRFARDPALLEALRGRHVRILPDADEAGEKAAASWLADLDAARVDVKICGLPPGCADLGPLVVPDAALSGKHDAALRGLFV